MQSCAYLYHPTSDYSSWMESSTISGFSDIPNDISTVTNEMSLDSNNNSSSLCRQIAESLSSPDFESDNLEFQTYYNFLLSKTKETPPHEVNTSPSPDLSQQLPSELENSVLTELGEFRYYNSLSHSAREIGIRQRGKPPPYSSAFNTVNGISSPPITNAPYDLNQYDNTKPPPPYRPPTSVNSVQDYLPPPPYAVTKSWLETCQSIRMHQKCKENQQSDTFELSLFQFTNKNHSDKPRQRSKSGTRQSKGAALSRFDSRIFATPPPDLTASGRTDVVFPWLHRDAPTSSEMHRETTLPMVDEASTADDRLSPASKRRCYGNAGRWRTEEEVDDTLLPADLDSLQKNAEIDNSSNLTKTAGTVKERIIQTFAREKKNAKSEGGGQVHLWQFLLELLSNPQHKAIILWEGEDGVFIFKKPDEVARLWGETKKKRDMNYEKLSRSLRYYYEKHIMSKVSGKHYSYKFHLDGLTRAYHPTGVSDSLYIQTYDVNCPSRNFPFPSPLIIESGSDPDEKL